MKKCNSCGKKFDECFVSFYKIDEKEYCVKCIEKGEENERIESSRE